MKKIAYLGPENTYGEKATQFLAQHVQEETTFVSLPHLESVAQAVSRNEVDLGVLPSYNYFEGYVQESWDLMFEHELTIMNVHRLTISFALGTHKECSDYSEVFSHPKALAQCSEWLWKHYPSSHKTPVASTAAAVQHVLKEKSGLAIASLDALREGNLNIIAENIGNKRHRRQNFTDFYLVSQKQESVYDCQKKYITAVALTPGSGKLGILANAFGELSNHHIPIVKFHTRPALFDIGEDTFEPQMLYLELATHQENETFLNCMYSMQSLLSSGNTTVETVRIMGSYESPLSTLEGLGK